MRFSGMACSAVTSRENVLSETDGTEPWALSVTKSGAGARDRYTGNGRLAQTVENARSDAAGRVRRRWCVLHLAAETEWRGAPRATAPVRARVPVPAPLQPRAR